MTSGDVEGVRKSQAQARPEIRRREPDDGDLLLARRDAAHQGERPLGNAQTPGEEGNEGLVGCALDRRGGKSHTQPLPIKLYPLPRGPRNDAHIHQKPPAILPSDM